VRDPFAFQGKSRQHYFEGWYFKNVAPDGAAYSFIPGVAFDSRGAGHSFVQVIRGADGASAYERYDVHEFSAARGTMAAAVGPNRFSRDGIVVDLPRAFGGIKGSLSYGTGRRLPRTLLRPGIMGWYRFVPFMECYHEVGSIAHRVSGTLIVGGEPAHFGAPGGGPYGRGYMEKDWGASMPSAWVWVHGNGFPDPDDSLMISIARIPWLGRSFTGFLGFASTGGRLVQFGTYSGARLIRVDIDGPHVGISVQAGSVTIDVEGTRSHTGALAAPVRGAMDRRIAESLDSTLQLTIHERGRKWTAGVGGSSGIEIVGDVQSLQPERRTSHGLPANRIYPAANRVRKKPGRASMGDRGDAS
jgi:tocopherol cyclase